MTERVTYPAVLVVAVVAVAIGPPAGVGAAEVKMKEDPFTPLPPGSVVFQGYLEGHIQNSINHWNKGVVPYADLVQMFRTGRSLFAQGEMWGKAVRSGCMFYRYTKDPELKRIPAKTVADLLTTRRANGSISCSDVAAQPDGPGGELWERKYVLLGLDGYYENVEKDPAVLQAMIDLADVTVAQVGPPPKVRIVDQGWSANHIESSTILEPMLRLYKRTGRQSYLEFARYIVEEEGGAKGHRIIEEALNNTDPYKIGGVYPKAYEMLSLFEGVIEYYRVTGDERWKKAVLTLYRNVREKEITIIGNGGGDQPYHPNVWGEAWDNTALEQTNPDMKRMMETCVGVTWLKLCSQILRLTGDPSAVDEIERYAYNGLIGAMKPTGDGFSYVNLLNGVKTNPEGWGAVVNNVHVTCCNLNGPMGLAYLPFVAVMNSRTGPVINLYNACTATVSTPAGRTARLEIATDYPRSGKITVIVKPEAPEKFSIRLRIPAWSASTELKVGGDEVRVMPGTYADIERTWSAGDRIELTLDMRCRLLDSPRGSNRAGDNHQALIRGPVVLARDENLDPDYNKPVNIAARGGYVDVVPVAPTLPSSHMQFRVPTADGSFIQMVDYASVDNWTGKHICTWLPKPPPATQP
ncbi:MAG: glycoside hydrolase family 127 protein [Phycisphaerae bacterium]|nr:glycoside hydrolase family 127 protein [Phycisphaerae bacterium]